MKCSMCECCRKKKFQKYCRCVYNKFILIYAYINSNWSLSDATTVVSQQQQLPSQRLESASIPGSQSAKCYPFLTRQLLQISNRIKYKRTIQCANIQGVYTQHTTQTENRNGRRELNERRRRKKPKALFYIQLFIIFVSCYPCLLNACSWQWEQILYRHLCACMFPCLTALFWLYYLSWYAARYAKDLWEYRLRSVLKINKRVMMMMTMMMQG